MGAISPIRLFLAFAISASNVPTAGAAARPLPGESIAVPFRPAARAGSFDPEGDWALWVIDTLRGYEAAPLRIPLPGGGARDVIYSIPLEKVVDLREPPGAPRPVPPDGESEAAAGAPRACVAGHRGREIWGGEHFPGSPLARGAVYAARTRTDGVHLIIHALAEPRPRDYGPLSDGGGRKLERAFALATTISGDIILAGSCGGDLVVVCLEDVFADELMEIRAAAVRRRFAEALKTAVRARSWSVTALGPHLDRP